MKWFYNMKISSKLICTSLLLALIAGMVGYVGISQLSKLSKADMKMYKSNVIPITLIAESSKAYIGLRVAMRDAMLAKSKDELDKYLQSGRDKIKELKDLMSGYEDRIASKEERETYNIFTSSVDKYGANIEKFGQLLHANKKDEAFAFMRGEFLVVATSGNAAIETLGKLNIDQAKATADENTATASTATTTMIIIIGVSVIVAVVLGLGLSRIIGNPIKQVMECAERLQSVSITSLGNASESMAHGILDVKIVSDVEPLQINSKDEVGALAQSVNGIINKTQKTVVSFELAMANLRKVTDEINGLIKSAQSGNLANRGKAENFEGGYREMVTGFNATLDAVVGPLQIASKYIDRISQGDIPEKITDNYQGDFNNIKNSLNRCIDSLSALIEDDGGAALLSAANKDLTARVKQDYQGAFDKMKTNINTLIQNLDEALGQVALAAEQVAAASGQISSGSQTLSQGSSEQASSLEEVSSSLQEMASMTKRNAEYAKEARSLSEGAQSTADRGVESMKRLSDAIVKIKVSSDSTAKIVKTIDEIAFQTNLLALNAAVEAARAGDAGKGFAVVAEEVRNLAQRSAEAAQNTANMIEESVKNAEGGVLINQEVLKNLTEINSQVNKVGAVMAEIAAASEQQSQGVEQVNTAVDQMNQVTQQVAANAEESASAAEELSGQSEEMKGMVAAFRLTNASMASTRSAHQQVRKQTSPAPKLQVRKPAEKVATSLRINGSSHHHVDPSKLIPFDGDDQSILKDF